MEKKGDEKDKERQGARKPSPRAARAGSTPTPASR